MKNLIVLFLVSFTFQSFSQDFEIPENYVLEAPADYAKHENDVISAVDWIIATPITKSPEKRKETYKFLITWLTSSPNVSVMLSQDVAPFIDNGDYMMIFMGGWTKYALESEDYKNDLKGSIAGVNAVISFHENNATELKKNKDIEKYIKIKSKGILEEVIKSKMP